MQASPLEARVHARTPPLRVLPYDDDLAGTFAEITGAWVEDMFTLEENDRAIIEDPRGTIIDRGGEILLRRSRRPRHRGHLRIDAIGRDLV